mmetsp:Transcript_5686/g.4834  ORF Transcript_5686/g.4834 Transcript_5686/m.4834 type:complete len:90 (-) Transcript_5686:483-752(-)
MQKTIIFTLAIFACLFSATRAGEAEDFFIGFSSAFNLTTAAQNVIKCSETNTTSLFEDIKALMEALPSRNISLLIKDTERVYHDLELLN